MSMFWCAHCDLLSDSDDGCEALADGLTLVCATCALDYERIEDDHVEEDES